MWEQIPDPLSNSHRLKVPGGWLVRTIVVILDSDKRPLTDVALTQIFVADANHLWQLEGPSDETASVRAN